MSDLATCRGCGQQYRDAYKLPDLHFHFQPIPLRNAKPPICELLVRHSALVLPSDHRKVNKKL
jgi:hypothetical protein